MPDKMTYIFLTFEIIVSLSFVCIGITKMLESINLCDGLSLICVVIQYDLVLNIQKKKLIQYVHLTIKSTYGHYLSIF